MTQLADRLRQRAVGGTDVAAAVNDGPEGSSEARVQSRRRIVQRSGRTEVSHEVRRSSAVRSKSPTEEEPG